ncbi:hypothetical protein C8Q77DRAFT_1067668 [Trametes polyzona]|nr:hypothetical protein C8Q77DRAFT_1067668 [Trametes polyzona]
MVPTEPEDDTRTRRLQPDEDSNALYTAWLALIPTLVPVYLTYLEAVQGRVHEPSIEPQPFTCPSGKCTVYTSTVLCLHFKCINISQQLVSRGLFPSSPHQPRVAISIDLLDFYFALFERSADAVTALAGALKTMYVRRGFPILNDKGEPVQDPFRRGLGHAVQWYDQLRSLPEDMVDSALDTCLRDIYTETHWCSVNEQIESEGEQPQGTHVHGSCSRLLQKRCPACFGGTRFGRNFNQHGGDIHVALDATFSQRHNTSAGESPWFYEPKYFVSKKEVDAAGARITDARKKPARKYNSPVPPTALDECEKSYEAADEKKEKTHGKKFDDTGLMALVCRHDIVLFLANIDSPGEQQKYAIALLERLFEEIPDTATVAAFYDIGCVLDRSIQSYELLPLRIASRLVFATSVMHAYGHQWACQLVYNPRLREGLGLSEGEGTERVWSKFRKLIGVTRSSARARRIWLLDRHADAMNRATREELGSWIRGRLKHGVEARTSGAKQDLAGINIHTAELRQQWEAQRTAQLSVRRHAPAQLKKNLDSVLNLQAELNTVEASLARLQSNVSEPGQGRPHTIVYEYIASLKKTHAQALEKVEGLYASLNVSRDFPELAGLPLGFVRLLLMARDLKINIRKRAIGSFFEWDKLSRAAGGRDQPLGTKLHQQTQKAIARRTPALTTAIRKFNGYCNELARLHQPEWNLPVPKPLPTELAILRDDPSLLADVWITPAPVSVPRWLQDADVRHGIRATLTLDRCLEERRRLGNEADNLCRWYGRELASVELALRRPEYSHFAFLLRQKKEELLLLQMRWRTPFVSSERFHSATKEASRIAQRITGASTESAPIRWVHLPIPEEAGELGVRNMEGADYTEDSVIAHDTLEQMLAYDDDEDDIDLDWDTTGTAQPPNSSVSPTLHDDLDMLVYRRRFILPARELQRLQRPREMLSDDCINTGAEVLARYFGGPEGRESRDLSILSTRVMSLHRAGSDDNALWRDTAGTLYWRADTWVIPIHHRSPDLHWTVAIIYLTESPPRIVYFDSFRSKTRLQADAEDLMKLVHRLLEAARNAGHNTHRPVLHETVWVAYPIATSTLQTNEFDCGVWVLACIAALLQGFDGLRLKEEELAQFRVRMFYLVCIATAAAGNTESGSGTVPA